MWMNVAASGPEAKGYNWYLNDHLATPQALVAPSGAVTWNGTSEPFGNTTVDISNAVLNNLRFPGQYFDKETSLHYNWQRYYDPALGKYTSTDPLGFGGGDDVLYRYTAGNPITRFDSDGLITIALPFPPTLGLPSGMGPAAAIVGAFYIGWQIGTYINDRWIVPDLTIFPAEEKGPQICNVASETPASHPVGRRGNPITVPSPNNPPTSIGGREYSGHAQDQIQGRGIPPSAVEEAIRNGTPSPGNTSGTTEHYDQKNDITVVTNKNGGVVTVKHGRPKSKNNKP